MANAKEFKLKPYKSYPFNSRDPIIERTVKVIADSGHTYEEAAKKSGVSLGTILNWQSGKTKRPQFATIMAVGRACGQTLVWQEIQTAKKTKAHKTKELDFYPRASL